MKITETNLKDCFVIEPNVYEDGRGYFYESFNAKNFSKYIGVNTNFVQDNESFSTKGVLRGLHFQKGKYAQAKLVRVVRGEVLDVAVDIRPKSKTFGKHFAIKLSETNKKQLYVPKGFAHGFVVLSKTAIFSYKCDNFYNKAYESGIIFNDPSLNIDWQIPEKDLIISEKDLELPVIDKLKL